MATLDELVVRIKADASQLERELKRTAAVTQTETKKIESSFAAVKNAIGAMTVSYLSFGAAVGAARTVVRLSDEYKVLEGRLKGVTQSTWELKQVEGELFAIAQRTGTGLSANAELYAKISMAAGELGKNQQEILTLTEAVGNAIAVSGGSAGSAAGAMLQFSQAIGGGIVRAEEFNSILEGAPRLAQAAADGLDRAGGSVSRLRSLIANGEVTSREFFEAITSQAETLAKEYENTEGVVSRSLTRLDNAMLSYIGRSEAVASVTSGLAKVIDLAASKFDFLADAATEAFQNAVPAVRVISMLGNLGKGEDEDMNAYLDKAKKAGFATEITQGTIIEPKAYGPRELKDYGAAFGPPLPAKSGGRNSVRVAVRETEELSDATKAMLDQMERGKGIYDQTRTKQEVYATKLAEARTLLNAGAIDLDTFTRYQDKLKDSMEDTGDQAVISAKLVKDSFADALESSLFDFENFGSGVSNILNGIARNIARKGFIDPLSNAVGGFADDLLGNVFGGGSTLPWKQSSGIFSGLGDIFGGFFADGGMPPVGRPSVVGEQGPEIFVPKTAGMIVPNHALGGQSVSVNNVFNIQGGVTKQELASLIPFIEQRTTQSVFAAIEQGGKGAQIVGRRN